jgi:hypothetical protein
VPRHPERGDQHRRQQGGCQHASLPAQPYIRGGARPHRVGPGLGHQCHADAELTAQAEPGNAPERQELRISLRHGAQPDEQGEQGDRPAQHAHPSDAVGQQPERDAAQHRARERRGDERGGLRRAKAERRRDRLQQEAEDQEVESVHGVADRRSPQRPPRLGGDSGASFSRHGSSRIARRTHDRSGSC